MNEPGIIGKAFITLLATACIAVWAVPLAVWAIGESDNMIATVTALVEGDDPEFDALGQVFRVDDAAWIEGPTGYRIVTTVVPQSGGDFAGLPRAEMLASAICERTLNARFGAGSRVPEDAVPFRVDVQVLDPNTGAAAYDLPVPVPVRDGDCVALVPDGPIGPSYGGALAGWQNLALDSVEIGGVETRVALFRAPRGSNLSIAGFSYIQACNSLVLEEGWSPFRATETLPAIPSEAQTAVMISLLGYDEDGQVTRGRQVLEVIDGGCVEAVQ